MPTISGNVDLANWAVSFGAGAKALPWKITTHPVVNPPETAPKIRIFPMKDKVGLKWEPVPGATGYAIYSTPSPDVQFPDAPDPNAECSRTMAVCSARWSATSPTIRSATTRSARSSTGAR